ncbi:hypothetical protein INR49_008347 [Caranx melampygus]|nr:hypothetical protein INR49_008347 [Caranx melampygus]
MSLPEEPPDERVHEDERDHHDEDVKVRGQSEGRMISPLTLFREDFNHFRDDMLRVFKETRTQQDERPSSRVEDRGGSTFNLLREDLSSIFNVSRDLRTRQTPEKTTNPLSLLKEDISSVFRISLKDNKRLAPKEDSSKTRVQKSLRTNNTFRSLFRRDQKKAEDRQDREDREDRDDAEDGEDIEDREDVEDKEDREDLDDTEDREDIEDKEDREVVEDREDVEDRQDVEDREDVEDRGDREDIRTSLSEPTDEAFRGKLSAMVETENMDSMKEPEDSEVDISVSDTQPGTRRVETRGG